MAAGQSHAQPDESLIHFKRAKILCTRREYSRALEECQKSLDINPNHVDANLLKAEILSKQNKFDEAKVVASSILKTEPLNVQATNILAVVELQNKNPGESIRLLHNALTMDPKNWKCHFNLAIALVQMGEKSRGFKEYLAAFIRHPSTTTLEGLFLGSIQVHRNVVLLLIILCSFIPYFFRSPWSILCTVVAGGFYFLCARIFFRTSRKIFAFLLLGLGLVLVYWHMTMIISAHLAK